MSVNRQVLIKIASELDYDLTPKSVDGNGNPVKRLVPTDYRRTPNPSAGEVQYKPLPDFNESKQDFANSNGLQIPKVVSPTMAGAMMATMEPPRYFNPDRSGFNTLKRRGIISPIPSSSEYPAGAELPTVVNVAPSSSDKNRPAKNKREFGMLDLDKARVRQLAGPNPSPYDLKLAEAIVRKSAERVRQARYNLLSEEGKKAYDAVAQYYGQNPHYSTIFLPGSLSQTWAKQNVGFPDVLYGSEGVGNPIAYDANANVPGYAPGDSSFVLDGFVYDKDGNINKTVLDNPYVKGLSNGNVVIQNSLAANPYDAGDDISVTPYSTERFLRIPVGDKRTTTPDITEGLALPGINVGNAVMEEDRKLLTGNDFGVLSPDDKKSKAWPSYNLDVLDHEAKHTMSRSSVLDLLRRSKVFKKKYDDVLNKYKDLDKSTRLQKTLESLDEEKKERENDPVLSDDYSGASNGFVRGKNGISYVQSGRGEHQRSMTDLKGFVENYLKETLPPQMKARGELDGLTEDEQIDVISDRILDIANDKKKFKEILRNHNIIGNGGEGVPDWFIEDSALGGTSRREAHRSINGFWRSTIPREQLRNYIRPGRDLEQIDNPGNRDYIPVFEKWLDENLHLIVNNNGAEYYTV